MMTARDLCGFFSQSDVVLVPVGSMEVHGRHLPLGTDTLIVAAIGELVARRVQIVRLPPIWCSIADTTNELPGTIHVPRAESAAYVKAVCRSLIENGFRSIVLINIHGRNNLYLPAVATELFEETDVPVLALDVYSCYAKELDPLLLGQVHNHLKETILLLGALRVLGLPMPDDVHEWRTQEIRKPEPLQRLLGVGTVGYYYNDEAEHIAPREGADADLGVAYLEAVADRLAATLDDLRAYREHVAKHGRRKKADGGTAGEAVESGDRHDEADRTGGSG